MKQKIYFYVQQSTLKDNEYFQPLHTMENISITIETLSITLMSDNKTTICNCRYLSLYDHVGQLLKFPFSHTYKL